MPTPEPPAPATPSNILQLCPAKKVSDRPPDPLIPLVAPKPVPGELMLVPYEDGVLFRTSPKPGAANGAFLIHDSVGTIVAMCVNKDMSNLFCAATHVYLQAARQKVEAEKTPEQTPTARRDLTR